MTEQPPAEAEARPAGPEEPPAPEDRPRRRTRSRRAPAAETPTLPEAAAEAPPAPEQQASAEASLAGEGPAAAPSRRGRGRQARSRRPPAAEATVEQPVAEIEAPEAPPAEAEGAHEPEPQLLPSQTTLRAPRRRRGGRGERGDRGEQQTAWQDQARAAPPQQRPDFRQPQQQPRRPETVESLIARQNVLFEEFAGQQTQALREMQRLVSNLSRGVGGGPGIALPKVAVFLDVPNLIYAAEQVGARIHFGRLLSYLTEGRQLVRATAYAPITDDPMTRFETQRFVAPVINQGWKVVTKPWKRFADGSMKANFDIELAVDILTMSDRLDIVVLLSGDGDFRRVCELVESKGVRVEVVAFASSTAMELRSVADSYTDLGSILKEVGY